MMKDHNICIATSIAPETRLTIQKQALQSWTENGIDVVSLNTSDEIENLQNIFPQIRFVAVAKDGREMAGRPVIFITDIIEYFSKILTPICGIVNSDIFIRPSSKLINFIKKNYNNSLLLGSRIEVTEFGSNVGQPDPYGYDAFFFDRVLLSDWAETKFCLGMPFWDHWFPITSLLAKRDTKKLSCSDIQHINHSSDRNDSFFEYNDYFANIIISYFNNNDVGFGENFEYKRYSSLRAAVLECETLLVQNEIKLKRYENLALFYDDLTKYVIRFINQQSNLISL